MKEISKEEIKKILELIDEVPEQYRAKAFELLLAHELNYLGAPISETKNVSVAHRAGEGTEIEKDTPSDFIFPIDVRAFLTQYSLGEHVISKVVLIEGQEVRPVYRLQETSKAKAQTKHALL